MLLAVLALLYSGVVQAAISPPLNWVVLHPFSWVPALWVFSRLEGRRALLAGWLVGIAAELAIYYWLPQTIERYGGLPRALSLLAWLLFAAGTGFYTAIFAWGFGRVRRAATGAWPFALAAWFCALEFLNPQLFGYLQGVAWYQMPRFFLISAVTGVTGVSFIVLVTNLVLLQGLELRRADADAADRRAWLRNTAVLALLVVVAVGYSTVRLGAIADAERAAPSMRLAVIQPNHTIERRYELASQQPEAFARDLLELSRETAARAGGKIDAFVWPEGALRSDPRLPYNRAVLDFARESGAEVWTGATYFGIEPSRQRVSHNSAFRLTAAGEIGPRYDKNILVPFGEYVPLREVIPGFDRIPAVADFDAGTSVPVYEAGPARFVFLICYEAIRSVFVRRAIADGANLIVNVTVDSWYGDTSEQSQHLMLAAMQSAMNGLPLVRSTTTGISAVVDARGILTQQSGKFTREALVSDVHLVRVPALYSRWGNWLAWLCVAASGVLLVAGRRSHLRTARAQRSANATKGRERSIKSRPKGVKP